MSLPPLGERYVTYFFQKCDLKIPMVRDVSIRMHKSQILGMVMKTVFRVLKSNATSLSPRGLDFPNKLS